MKRIAILLILALNIPAGAAAQSSQRQKVIHMAAVRIAGQIEVPESSKDAFILLYQNYKKESGEIMKIQPVATEGVEAAAEAKILSDFDKSDKLLRLRKAYYSKFREFLSPLQIQKMYDLEREMISSN